MFPRVSHILGVWHLHAVVHVPPALPMAVKECDDKDCRRCRQKLGGYAYRWAHSSSITIHETRRRTGSRGLDQVPGVSSGAFQILFKVIEYDRDVGE